MTTNEVIGKLRENVKRGGRRIQNRVYRISTEGNTEIRLSPQAITCLEILFSSKKKELQESEVAELISANAEKFGKTKQEPWKIFQYYRKALKDAGFLTVETIKS